MKYYVYRVINLPPLQWNSLITPSEELCTFLMSCLGISWHFSQSFSFAFCTAWRFMSCQLSYPSQTYYTANPESTMHLLWLSNWQGIINWFKSVSRAWSVQKIQPPITFIILKIKITAWSILKTPTKIIGKRAVRYLDLIVAATTAKDFIAAWGSKFTPPSIMCTSVPWRVHYYCTLFVNFKTFANQDQTL